MQTHAFDDALTATARGRVRLPSMPGQSEVGTCERGRMGNGTERLIPSSGPWLVCCHSTRPVAYRNEKLSRRAPPAPTPEGLGRGSWSLHVPAAVGTGQNTIRPSASLHTAVRSATAPCSCITCAARPLMSSSVAAENVFFTPCPAFHWAWGEQLQRRGELPRTRP